MMIVGHRTVAAPFALATTSVVQVLEEPPLAVQIIMGILIIWSCSWNDYDHPSGTATNELGFVSRAVSHVVRFVSFSIYLWTRTDKDKKRADSHRGFTHTIEGCLAFSIVVYSITVALPWPPVHDYAHLWAMSVFAGTISHLFGDMMTPSGIPLQITFKIGGMRWQRYAFGWEWNHLFKLLLWDVKYPTFALVVLDGKKRKDRVPGLFYTDSWGEHNIAIPIIWAVTAGATLVITGTFMPLVMMVLGL
jgi:membrane-bound metal-dependent hydrolase YbcI (DUF457 family)